MKPCPKNRRRRKRASCHVNGHCTLLRTSKEISVYLRFERGKAKHWTEPCPSPACRSPCGAFPGTNLPSAVSLQGRNSSCVIDAKCVLLSASARGSRAQTAQTVETFSSWDHTVLCSPHWLSGRAGVTKTGRALFAWVTLPPGWMSCFERTRSMPSCTRATDPACPLSNPEKWEQAIDSQDQEPSQDYLLYFCATSNVFPSGRGCMWRAGDTQYTALRNHFLTATALLKSHPFNPWFNCTFPLCSPDVTTCVRDTLLVVVMRTCHGAEWTVWVLQRNHFIIQPFDDCFIIQSSLGSRIYHFPLVE